GILVGNNNGECVFLIDKQFIMDLQTIGIIIGMIAGILTSIVAINTIIKWEITKNIIKTVVFFVLFAQWFLIYYFLNHINIIKLPYFNTEPGPYKHLIDYTPQSIEHINMMGIPLLIHSITYTVIFYAEVLLFTDRKEVSIKNMLVWFLSFLCLNYIVQPVIYITLNQILLFIQVIYYTITNQIIEIDLGFLIFCSYLILMIVFGIITNVVIEANQNQQILAEPNSTEESD
ncbi:MAG: hypothetical protein ACPGVB_04815, partial [Chitinophagales bacterium]